MKVIFILFALISFQTSFAQLDFLDCPRDSIKRFVRDYKLIPGYFDSTWNGRILYDTKPDSSFLFKYEKNFECGTNGHWRVSTVLIWSIPLSKTEFILNIAKGDSLNLPIAYFMGSGGGLRYNFYARSAEGYIKGKLIDDSWLIEVDLTTSLFNSSQNLNTQHKLQTIGIFKRWIAKNKNDKQHLLSDF